MATKVNFSCTYTFFFVPLHREPTSGMSAHQLAEGSRHIKKAFIDACFGLTKSGKFQSPKQDAVSVLMVCISLRSCNVYTYQRGRYYLFLD